MIHDQRRRKGRKRTTAKTFEQIGAVVKLPAQNTIIRDRLIEAAGLQAEIDQDITFQHSIFCQTSLPYRNPGMDVRRWQRRQGDALLEIEAGRAFHPGLNDFVDAPLPCGPKARLILMHLNSEAVRAQSPHIDVGESLTSFVKRIGIDPKGRNVNLVRDQVTALSCSIIRLGFSNGIQAKQMNAIVVDGFELWLPKDDNQRVLWPSFVELNQRYFDSLMEHAVPLDERAIAALSHSAMALDIYAWLAQRLHRIPKPHRQLIPWVAVKDQFGQGYKELYKFRQVFMEALRQVHAVYRHAKIDVTDKGIFLYTSPPPVSRTGVVLKIPATSK